jgi:hypothetical protein
MSETKTVEKVVSLSPVEQLFEAASTFGFELDQERADRLVKKAEYTESLGDRTSFIFEENGLQIKRPVRMGVSGVPLSNSASMLDFIPQVDKDSNIIVNPNPQRGSTTQITLMGIEAFQDFVLMAEARLVPKPERFYGNTNPTMARFAKRVGFTDTRLDRFITATYEDVAARIFSPEIIDTQHRLEERQAVLAAGTLAVKS